MSKKTREEILCAKRKASNLRYAKIKSDPELNQLRKEKDKENYLKKKNNKRVMDIRKRNTIEQEKQREKWRQNSRAYYLRKNKQKEVHHVNVNENVDGDNVEAVIGGTNNETDPLEPLCSKESHDAPNEKKPKVTILSDVRVNYDLKKLFRSSAIKKNWEFNCSSINVAKDFKEFGN